MPGGLRARRYSLRLPLEAYSTRTYRGPGGLVGGGEDKQDEGLFLLLFKPGGFGTTMVETITGLFWFVAIYNKTGGSGEG